MTERDDPLRPGADEDQPNVDERSIAQVGSAHKSRNAAGVIIGVAVVGLLLWFVNRGAAPETDTRLTDAADLDFDAPVRRAAPVLAPPPAESVTRQVAAPPPDPFDLEMRRIALRQAEEAQRLAEQRRRAPILIVDQKHRGSGNPLTPDAGRSNAASVSSEGGNAGLAGELTNAAVDSVNATVIESPSQMIAQGALIRGVLETAIQSDLPGFVRASVAHDVYAFDGSQILIPKASRLVGQYRSGLVRGQTRVFIVWDRVLRPDGVSILISSPGTDLLGRSGLEGHLDTHFFKIFGSSVLLSLVDGAIDVAVQEARSSVSDGSTTILQNSSSLNRAAEIALENSINIPPTIHIDQGTAIQVFVARDLNFASVAPR